MCSSENFDILAISVGMSPGGDVFVLAIQNATVNDTGMYVCEVNSSPVVRSYHELTGENICMGK